MRVFAWKHIYRYSEVYVCLVYNWRKIIIPFRWLFTYKLDFTEIFCSILKKTTYLLENKD